MAVFLGTGCGRSGTLWTARFFTELGFPTYHEAQFGPETTAWADQPEVSWLAMPFLDDIPDDVRLLQVVRNPYDVVISAMQLEFQREPGHTPFDRFLEQHAAHIVDAPDKLTRMIRWVSLWDAPLWHRRRLVIRPDVDDDEQLRGVVRRATGVEFAPWRIAEARRTVGDRVNHKRRSSQVTRDDIDSHPEGWRIRRRAEHYGYA